MSTTTKPAANATRQFRQLTVAAGVLLWAGLVAGTADARDTDALVVRYHSFELESNAAALELYGRIDRQVRRYCMQHGVLSATRRREERQCHAELLDKAINRINSDRLSSIHSEHKPSAQIAAV